MITTGSKLLFGATVAAIVAAVIFGLIDEGKTGTFSLVAAAVAFSLVAGINLFARDANVLSTDDSALTDSAAAQAPVGPSMWPLVAAFGAGVLVVGLVTTPIAFYLGLVVLAAAGAEWALAAWSERASASREFNASVRGRLAYPLEFPVLGAVGIGIIVYSFSRIMLVLSKAGGPIVFGLLAALVLAAGFVVASIDTPRPVVVGAVAGLALVGLAAGGVAGALQGEREFHPHETWAGLGSEGQCDQADEVEADERASQTVANKANVTAEITVDDDGTLAARTSGEGSGLSTLTLTKSNATNVLFRNESDEARRLVLDLGTKTVEDDEGNTEEIPDQRCTALVEPGGAQMMTFVVAKSSVATGQSYGFVVPGLDNARVEVVVP